MKSVRVCWQWAKISRSMIEGRLNKSLAVVLMLIDVISSCYGKAAPNNFEHRLRTPGTRCKLSSCPLDEHHTPKTKGFHTSSERRDYLICLLFCKGQLDYLTSSPLAEAQILTSAKKTSTRHKHQAVSDQIADIPFEMGSGEISDNNQLPADLTPQGNVTVEDDAGKEDTDGGIVGVTEQPVPEGDESTDSSPVTSKSKMTTTMTTVKTTEKMIGSQTQEKTTNSTTTTTTTTTTPVVVVPSRSSNAPYMIVTHSEDVTTTQNITAGFTPKSSNAGAIIGVVVALLLIGIIITILVVLMKKKRIKVPKKVSIKRKKMVAKMENPQYKNTGVAYRFSRDSTLHLGNTANLTKFNNPNLADTPVPRVLQSESPSTAKRSSLPKSIASRREKRKAPPPPNPFGDNIDELYEKASHGSDVELQTFSVQNENAIEPTDTNTDQTYPLLKRPGSTKEKPKSRDKNDNTKEKADPEAEPDNGNGGDPGESLLPKEKSANQDQASVDITLDEYDMTKNPFFAKT